MSLKKVNLEGFMLLGIKINKLLLDFNLRNIDDLILIMDWYL